MKKVVSFLGGDHRVGTTMTADCCAAMLAADLPDSRLLVIHAQSPGAAVYTQTPGLCIDDIAPHLEKRNPDPDEILERSLVSGGLHVISSGSRLGSAGDIHPDSAGFLLEILRDRFDLIICDAGCEPDRGFSLGLLMASVSIFPIITQNENCLRRFEWLSPLYDRLGLRLRGPVIGCFSSSAAFSAGYMSRRLGISTDDLLSVRESRFGEQAESEGKLLLSYRDSGFKRDIAALCELLSEKL